MSFSPAKPEEGETIATVSPLESLLGFINSFTSLPPYLYIEISIAYGYNLKSNNSNDNISLFVKRMVK